MSVAQPESSVRRIKLTGSRFNGGRLPVDSLVELARYHELLRIVARSSWRQDHPGEELPAYFDAEVSLTMRSANRSPQHTSRGSCLRCHPRSRPKCASASCCWEPHSSRGSRSRVRRNVVGRDRYDAPDERLSMDGLETVECRGNVGATLPFTANVRTPGLSCLSGDDERAAGRPRYSRRHELVPDHRCLCRGD